MPRLGDNPDASDEERDRDWFFALMRREDPSRRGMCLAAASAVENMLNALLSSHGRKKRLSFDALIKLAHAHGVLGDTESATCQVIKDIRNVFAHEERAYFSVDPLFGLAARLKELDSGLAGSDGSWLYRQAVTKVALALRAKMREAGLMHNS